MQVVTTVGLDIAKSVFQVHGIDAAGQVVIRRQLKRRYVLAFFEKLPPCLVGIEACASSHHWSRELKALGHTVKLMPPAYVKPYVKRQKNDATDAEAICEAATRANMRFVANSEPSTHGPKRTSLVAPHMSAFGDRADKNRRQIALAPAAQWFVENVAPRLDREKRAGVNTGVNIHGAVTVTLR